MAFVPRSGDLWTRVGAKKPDLVMMDLEGPGEDAFALVKRAPREKEKYVPTVLLAPSLDPDIEKKGMESGAAEIILREASAKEFCQRTAKIIEAKDRLAPFGAPRKDQKILIVDDEEGVRKYLSLFFQRKGYETLTAQNGEEAIRIVQEKRPPMILLDIRMPGVDGIETLRKIRILDAQAGIVMAIAVQDEQVAKEAMALGAYAYAIKPFDMQYLELVVLTRLLLAA